MEKPELLLTEDMLQFLNCSTVEGFSCYCYSFVLLFSFIFISCFPVIIVNKVRFKKKRSVITLTSLAAFYLSDYQVKFSDSIQSPD